MSFFSKSVFVLSLLISSSVFAENKLVWMEGESEESPKPFMIRGLEKGVTNDIRQGIYPSISSDGSEVSYLAGNTRDQYLLETYHYDSDLVEQWFEAPGAYYHPDYSGDNKFLVVSGPGESKNQLILIDLQKARSLKIAPINNRKVYSRETLDSIGATKVIATEGGAFFPELSSDASFVVAHLSFATDQSGNQPHGRGKRKQIFLINVQKGTSRAITNENEHCMEPAFSADDLYIAFVCRVHGEADKESEQIFVYGPLVQGQEVRTQLTHEGERNLTPHFTNNGTIIFSSMRDGQYDLYEQSYRQASAAAKRLTNSKMIEYAPSSSGNLSYRISSAEAKLNDMRSSFALISAQDQAFVIGGHTGNRHEYNEKTVSKGIEIWNGNEWKKLSVELAVAVQGVRGVYHHNVIDLFGGLTHVNGKPTSLDIVQRCYVGANLEVSKCEVLEGVKLSAPRSSYEIVELNNRVYILGGAETKSMREQIFRSTVEVVDISSPDIKISTFAQEFPQPYRRGFKAVSDSASGVGYLIGGMTEDSLFLKDVVVFNPAGTTVNEVWTKKADLPLGLFSTSAGILNDKLYTFGGAAYFGPAKPANPGEVFKYAYYLNHIHVLDLKDPQAEWKNTGRYMSDPKAFLEVLNSKSDLLIIGGTTSTNEPVSKVERWTVRD